ncbi:Crp/Fnr family transcriptional regulator [Kitasatospora nipponensis]|uniref:Crp/Fnr family transcriptional regulator n=1 Tax=Kitasatospora nipponensis TaxID=258049 RepID=A0ABN1WYP3_9ACTN
MTTARTLLEANGEGPARLPAPVPAHGPLAELPAPAREKLGRLGTRRVYSPGEALMIEGDRDDRVALLLTGCVKVVGSTEDGGEALLAVRVPGELLGELAVLDGGPRSATVLAVRTSTTREIGGTAFRAFLAEYPEAAAAVQRSVSHKLRSATRHRVDAGCGTVLVRLARTLHTLICSYGRPTADGLRIDVPLSHADLAALAGLSQASVERSLRTLRSQGAIRTRYRELVVSDEHVLCRAAGLSARTGREAVR